MSRHKLVKNLDLDHELDDFDGGANYDFDEAAGEEEVGAEDKEQLREGTIKVRDVLGQDGSVTDKEIQDSLWHYYYDVEKTITYILNQRTGPLPKKPKKKMHDSGQKALNDPESVSGTILCSSPCLKPLSAAGFFEDSPWLNIPKDRCGEIIIEPLYPRGGLLGGSSKSGGAPVSKLAALAAARKKKENEKSNDGVSRQQTRSVALLDKLGGKSRSRKAEDDTLRSALKTSSPESSSRGQSSISQTRKYPLRRRKSSSPPPPVKETHDELPAMPDNNTQEVANCTAPPSTFARTMFGMLESSSKISPQPLQPLHFHLPYNSGLNSTESSPFSEPSPDDMVLKAQNSKGSKAVKGNVKPSQGDKSTAGVANGLSKVALDDVPKAKNKNLNVLAEYEKAERKNAANFVVIGHVDAGKSTLMGRLLYDLKVVDQRTIEKYRREAERIGKSSFALAWVLDQGTEERSRGVTIDIATNKFETEKTSFTILDAPGHRDFIPNMIAGASQADFAVLVIDASIGSFESGLKGQTREHALLVRSMGVQRIIVAVNKLDNVHWSRDRFEEIEQQVSAFLTTAGFQAKNIAFVPCSGLTGDNIARRAEDAEASWYRGPILIEQLETSEPITRALEKPLRLTIGDVFRGGVQNPLSISGRMDSGYIQVGEQILAMPSGESAIIKGIEVDQEPSDWAVAGQNVTLHLIDIDQIHLRTGDVICLPSSPIKNITTFTTKVLAFDHLTPMHVEVHRGRLHAPGRITRLVAVLDKGSGAVVKKKPRLVQPGSVARVVVELGQSVPLEAPGRVILRAGGETVAAGLLE